MNVTTTLLGALGFLLLLVGFVLILAGLRIIIPKQYVEIQPGVKASVAGLLAVSLGALLLLPEARTSFLSSPKLISISATSVNPASITALPYAAPSTVVMPPSLTPSSTLVEQPFEATDQPQPTSAIQPTPASEPVKFPNLIISSTANNGVSFVASRDGNYTFTIVNGVYCTAKGLCRTIIHGYVNRGIVWQNWYGKPHPMEQDYEIGCWEQDTAVNSQCGIGRSTTVFLKAQEYIRWIVMEDKNAFGDNTGEVVLAVEQLR